MGCLVKPYRTESSTLLSQLCFLLGDPAYVLLVLGYAAYTFTIIGISSFGPQFFLGLGLFESETTCSLVFGCTAALGGFIGTPLGGVLLDKATRLPVHMAAQLVPLPGGGGGGGGGGVPSDCGGLSVASDGAEAAAAAGGGGARELWQASRILRIITAFIAAGGVVLIIACATCGWLPQPAYRPLSLLCLCVGVLLCFATSSGITRAVMLLVPAPMRGFAIAICSLGLHASGDVPAPLLVGLVKDARSRPAATPASKAIDGGDGEPLAPPRCDANGTLPLLNPQCRASATEQEGLRLTLMATGLWIVWATVLWGLCYLLLRRRARRALRAEGCP